MISKGVVALRSYPMDAASRLGIEREIEIATQPDCPFIVPCFDHFVDAGRWWLVQEYCAGGSLRNTLASYHEDIAEGWAASQVGTAGI